MSPLSQHIEVNTMNDNRNSRDNRLASWEMVYYPLDLDPFVRAHVCVVDNTTLYQDHRGHRFAVSSRRLRRLWNFHILWWDAIGYYIEVK